MNGRVPHNKILLKEVEADEVTESGIQVVEGRQKQATGEIVLIGNVNYANMPINLKKGNKILFLLYQGTKFNIEKEEYILLDINDVLYCY